MSGDPGGADAVDQTQRVRAGYNALSRAYRGEHADDRTQAAYGRWLGWVRDHVEEGATVLDVGCGNGIPAAKWLVDNGFRVTGVDVSDEMVDRARQLVPSAEFIRADVGEPAEFDPPAGSYAAVVSFYTLIHLPLAPQQAVVDRIGSWLRPGGLFVGTVGHNSWQGREAGWLGGDTEMLWSHPDIATFRSWLDEAGLEIVHEELVPEDAGGHQLLVAHRV